ncbi:MAG: endolytic transglycosylase MltG [Patescibacteria group bacterium]|nr:endolytic transglycosylase MltG [Patescibacteria group bacterium]
MKRFLFVSIFLLLASVAVFTLAYSWLNDQVFDGTASPSNIIQKFEMKEGDGSTEIGENLEKEGLIKNKNFFYFYVWKTKAANFLQAGTYELAPNMTIGQMVEKFSNGDVIVETLKLTIPEGYTNKKIVNALRSKKPSIADEFENIVNCKCLNRKACSCDVFSKKYDFLRNIPQGIDMEGYLFPDTYFIDGEEAGATMASKFLNNFNKKINQGLKDEIAFQERSLHDVVTLASIIEREVKTDKDRRLVSGIFRKRLDDKFPLQSCATLAYFLNVDKPQFSYEDTQCDSLYNTYINPGLPPGPISNPGFASIRASIFPQKSDFYYFLSNSKTEEIIYSKTFDEHQQRKAENGL